MAVWEACVTCPSRQQSKGCCSHHPSSKLLFRGTAPTVLPMLCCRHSAFFLQFHPKTIVTLLWFGNAKIKCGFFPSKTFTIPYCACKTDQTKNPTDQEQTSFNWKNVTVGYRTILLPQPCKFQSSNLSSTCLGMVRCHLHFPGKMLIVVTEKENHCFFRQSRGSEMKYASLRARTQEFCTFFSPALLDLIFKEDTCSKQSFC